MNAILQVEGFRSPLGPMVVAATTEVLSLVEFDVRDPETRVEHLNIRLGCSTAPGGNEITRQAVREIEEVFAGMLTEFSVPLVDFGTVFQRLFSAELREINYGRTASYG